MLGNFLQQEAFQRRELEDDQKRSWQTLHSLRSFSALDLVKRGLNLDVFACEFYSSTPIGHPSSEVSNESVYDRISRLAKKRESSTRGVIRSNCPLSTPTKPDLSAAWERRQNGADATPSARDARRDESPVLVPSPPKDPSSISTSSLNRGTKVKESEKKSKFAQKFSQRMHEI